jgi:hypothetical protein
LKVERGQRIETKAKTERREVMPTSIAMVRTGIPPSLLSAHPSYNDLFVSIGYGYKQGIHSSKPKLIPSPS